MEKNLETVQTVQTKHEILIARKGANNRWQHEPYRVVKGNEEEAKRVIAQLQVSDPRFQKGKFEFHYRSLNA